MNGYQQWLIVVGGLGVVGWGLALRLIWVSSTYRDACKKWLDVYENGLETVEEVRADVKQVKEDLVRKQGEVDSALQSRKELYEKWTAALARLERQEAVLNRLEARLNEQWTENCEFVRRAMEGLERVDN